MGFANFDPDEAEPVSNRSKSSGGGGSSESDGYSKLPAKHVPVGKDKEENYPFYCIKAPSYALVEHENGYDWYSWPAAPEVRFEKEEPGQRWSMVDQDKLAIIFWDELEYKRIRHIVNSELGGDLVDLLQNSPEMALEAVDLAERLAKDNSPAYETVSCECCDREYHKQYGDYHSIGDRVLCGCHTVDELVERDIV